MTPAASRATPGSTRDVLLVGSVPLRPAAKVFELVADKLGDLAPRIPDGDQHGWALAAVASFAANEALYEHRRVLISQGGVELPRFRLQDGLTAEDLTLGPYGFAETAAESYREFRRLRDVGKIPASTRFQVTLPGPGTSAHMVELPPEELLPIAREALRAEVDGVVEAVPAADLTIQLDIAMEAEHEEYRRRPEAFETPVHEAFDWTLEQMADAAAWLADRVPPDVELGLHICSIWHHYQAAGQDNAVLVDIANAILTRVTRPIGYLHIPTIPEHGEADFALLEGLRTDPGTRLYLGVIHASDGLEGARRRIRAARAAVPDFGIASFCGLGLPAVADRGRPPAALALGATPATVGEVLELHRRAAAV